MTVKRITQAELEGYLWGAANLLRGSIDAGEYKNFIFPLLFLKRLSDVYDEEYENAISKRDKDLREEACNEIYNSLIRFVTSRNNYHIIPNFF